MLYSKQIIFKKMNKQIKFLSLLLFIVLSTFTVDSFANDTIFFRYSDPVFVAGNPVKFQYKVQIRASATSNLVAFNVRSNFSTSAFIGTQSSISLVLNPAFSSVSDGFLANPPVAGAAPKFFSSTGSTSGAGAVINTNWVTLLTVSMDVASPCDVAGLSFVSSYMNTRNKYKPTTTAINYVINVAATDWSNQGLGYLAPASTTWNGSVSSNWASTGNWSNGVPCSSTDVTIDGNSPVYNPLVLDQNVSCNNLTILDKGKLTVNSGKTLAVAGTFTIKDGGSYINNGTGANTATVERTIPSDNSWHFVASPVDGAPIKPSFATSVYSTTFDFYKWDEATSQAVGYFPWINIRPPTGSTYASGFDNFEIARGYLVAYSSGWNSTHSFVGTLGNGDKTIAITKSMNTYNLIGNPYPSAINWDNATLQSNALASLGSLPEIRIWNSNSGVGQYGVYVNGAGVNGASNIIAPNQAFFVKAIAANSFVIPNTARVHGAQAFLKSTPSDLLRLKVNSTANTYTDEMIVRFDANATNDGVTKWSSMIATAPSLYSVKNNENYTINTLTGVSSNLVVPVGFKAGANGMYSITASELNSFSTPTYVYLKDLTNNTITDLNSTAMYSFAATTTDNADRFQLIFALSPLSISNNVKENTNIYSYDNTIYVNSNENIKQIDVYNTLGQLIKTFENKSGSIVVNMNGNVEGYYIVKVITNTNVYSQKVLVK